MMSQRPGSINFNFVEKATSRTYGGVNIALLMTYLILLYPTARFVFPQAGLFAASAIALFVTILFKFERLSLWHIPRILTVLLFTLMTTASLAIGNAQAATYWAFVVLFTLFEFCLSTRLIRLPLHRLVWMLVAFAMINLAVEMLDLGRDASSATLQVNEGSPQDGIRSFWGGGRFSGVFLHANEAGVFFLALTLILYRGLEAIPGRFRIWSGYSLSSGLVGTCLLMTGSLTAIAAAILYVLLNFVRGAFGKAIMAFGLLLTFCSQLFFPQVMAELIQSGSFWWRYMIASRVTSSAPTLTFAPWSINSLENWTHSIAMDLLISLGWIPTVLILLAILWWVMVANWRTSVAVFTVLLTVAFQPAGAMPTSMLAMIFCLLVFPVWRNGDGPNMKVRHSERG